MLPTMAGTTSAIDETTLMTSRYVSPESRPLVNAALQARPAVIDFVHMVDR